ncbi:uncharacterized protein LOC120909785 [Rana temporaria]|uniref:uncharacterized protein LOC120909785 n=1 Tax=Rana temporaria TaxID=8407 RepID=UPI001AACD2D2|nr:uncharacterized protein LOC120909785 [Rana temporaria]
MRTLYITMIFGVLLPSASAEDWDLEKMRQCTCSMNATKEIPSAVARGCITDPQGQRVTLRLSPSEHDGCIASILHEASPGEIYVIMNYNGKLDDATKRSQDVDGTMMTADQSNPEDEMEFSFKLDVAEGKLYTSEPLKKYVIAIKRRRREIMPFSFMTFNIAVRLDGESTCDMKDQTESLLVKGIKRYWLQMALCLLDATE